MKAKKRVGKKRRLRVEINDNSGFNRFVNNPIQSNESSNVLNKTKCTSNGGVPETGFIRQAWKPKDE